MVRNSGMRTERLYQGRYLTLEQVDGWEFCRRRTARAAVAVVALTPEGAVLLTEQFRPPLGAPVIEFPAGLVGDDPGQQQESLELAAERELEEETGFRAERLRPLAGGPTSAGLTDEVIHFFAAEGLTRVGPGGGVEGERIEIHAIAPEEIDAWLEACRERGVLVDPKVYAGLYLIGLRA